MIKVSGQIPSDVGDDKGENAKREARRTSEFRTRE